MTTQTDTAPLSARLRSLDDETVCFDAVATYGLIREPADALDALSARVKELEAAQERATGTIRELSAACHKRADERDEARAANDYKCLDDWQHREEMAGALSMSWDACDPFEWPEIIARANELRTTLKMRPDWKARATQAEAERDALREAARPIAAAYQAIQDTWMGKVADDVMLTWGDITAGQMRALVAALSPAQPAQSADPLVTAYDNGVDHAWGVAQPLAEAAEGVINWCDFAMSQPGEFDAHGVRNLSGPAFDKLREAVEAVRSAGLLTTETEGSNG